MGNANLGNKSNKKPQEKRTRVLGGNDEQRRSGGKKTYVGKLSNKNISSGGNARKFVPSGVTPELASEYVDSLGGNVQKAWHSWGPGAIRDYMSQGMSFSEARAEAMGDFGYDIDPLGTGPKLWSGYTWEPQKRATPPTPVYGYDDDGGGGGGGGGGGYAPPTPPIPEMKIRTTAGQRHDQYWESMPPYNRGFEPRFVILGSNQDW